MGGAEHPSVGTVGEQVAGDVHPSCACGVAVLTFTRSVSSPFQSRSPGGSRWAAKRSVGCLVKRGAYVRAGAPLLLSPTCSCPTIGP